MIIIMLELNKIYSYGVEIELLDKKEYTEQEELVNDMMMLIASFSGRLYSARAKERKQEI